MLAGQWLAQKAIQKQSSFGEKTPLNVQHYSSGQQADFSSACCHHTPQQG